MGRGWGWLGIAVGAAAVLGLLAIPNGSGGNSYGGAICASVIGGPDGDQPIVMDMGGVDEADTKEAIRTGLLDCERQRGSRLGWALAVATPTAVLLGGLLATLPPRGRRAAEPGYR
ncbi:hypothetical protein ACFCYB_14675 [Streptomyces sp. NPDC056309]|uniref:hypothetical protein n=1 Tax=unclassified Streptomyces TaxID=2593676 RepID=UPI0035DFF7F4